MKSLKQYLTIMLKYVSVVDGTIFFLIIINLTFILFFNINIIVKKQLFFEIIHLTCFFYINLMHFKS